ncbi:integral membrane plasmid transfer protein [Streptomyces sp. NWU49]|uniref:Pycsar system effector family protein n=1 Tax=Streptomyces sp. NWU49 TaxID=2201153 RepID=UPI000D681DB0|nr:Pycsar system effector family protein [Streptomyces sp. NWU49]PWJ09368.1 integral membrane plasmid transfer protein [Streptomyces sp. NWU49]
MSAVDRTLSAAHAEVRAEIARTDSKTALLLAFVGAVLAGSWTAARDLPLNRPALVVGGVGLALLVGAAGLLLWSVRPNLGGPHRGGRHGFPLWATLTAEEIPAAVSSDLAADIAGLSRLAVAKFTGLRRAVDLTMAGGALLLLAALLTAGGAA